MQLAELAEKEADSAGGSTEQEISGIGKQVKDLASTSQSSAKGLWDQLGNEMQKRNEAMASERKNLVQNTHQLLDKISDVTTSLGKSAGEAANKQRNLEEKVGMMQTMMEEEMEKARREQAAQPGGEGWDDADHDGGGDGEGAPRRGEADVGDRDEPGASEAHDRPGGPLGEGDAAERRRHDCHP